MAIESKTVGLEFMNTDKYCRYKQHYHKSYYMSSSYWDNLSLYK